jgi:PKD repeat protein
MLWSLDVFTDDCIHEIDPTSGVTGNTICPGFPVSQRGLAYDGSNDTWYAGGWNDAMVYHFDSAGNPLGSWNTGLPISGLAYNPDSMHLFVMVNSPNIPNPIYVLDASNNMAVIGQFTTTKGFSAYSGAGLEMDCDGHLWAVDQNASIVYEIDSGETTTMCYQDVPWLSEDPISGTIVSAAGQTIQVSFDAGVPEVTQLGKYFAQLKIVNDTPYFIENIPVTMTVVAATPPVVSFNSNSPVLLGEPTIFTNTSDPGAPAATEYEWSFGDGTSETHAFGDAVSHLYSHYGSFTVTLTTQNPVDSDTATAQVVVQAAPQVSFTSNSPVMIGETMVFTNTSDPGYPAANVFTWDFGDGVVETLGLGDSVSHTYANAGTYMVTLEACNAIDCDTFTADVVVGYIGIYLPIINKP